MMALTKDFKDTIQARAQRDSTFRKALLQEGVECLLAGDIDTGKNLGRFGNTGQTFVDDFRPEMLEV